MTFCHIFVNFLLKTLLLPNCHQYVFLNAQISSKNSTKISAKFLKICAKYFSPRAQIQLAAVGRTISPHRLFTNLVFSFRIRIFSFKFSKLLLLIYFFSICCCFYHCFCSYLSILFYYYLRSVLQSARRRHWHLKWPTVAGNSRRPLCSIAARAAASY